MTKVYPVVKTTKWQLDSSVFTTGLARQMVWLSALLLYN